MDSRLTAIKLDAMEHHLHVDPDDLDAQAQILCDEIVYSQLQSYEKSGEEFELGKTLLCCERHGFNRLNNVRHWKCNGHS